MTQTCILAGGDTCVRPNLIVADLVLDRVIARGSVKVPLCFGHAVKPYLLQRAIRAIFGKNAIRRIRVVPREPYRSILKRYGIE